MALVAHGEERARPEQEAELAGGLGGLPEKSAQLRAAVEPSGQAPQAQQPEVRVGGLRQPVEQEGDHGVHQTGGAGEALGQLDDGVAGAGGVRKAEGRQSLAYGHRPEEARAGLDGRPGSARNGPPGAEGLQEGPEKEAFVDGPGRRLMVGEVGVETGQSAGAGAVPVTEHARQMSPRRCAGRDGVDLAVLEELQAVLDGPQEPVGRGEALGIGVGHVPARCQGGQRAQGARGPQSLVLAAVHQLEQLDGELDVAYAAPSQLYLPLCEPVAGHRLFGPGLHGPQRAQVVGTERPAPYPLGRLQGESRPELVVACGRPGFQEGLELPRLGPAVPVGLIRGQAADEHAGTALGAQVQVCAPRLTGHGQHGVGVAPAHQHDVDVAAVVELAGTELAHRHHGHVVAHARAGRGRPEHAVRQVGQRAADGLQGDLARKVPGGDA